MYLYLKQKVFTIRESLTFFDKNQQPVYTVKGSLLKIPHRLTICNAEGTALIQVKTKIFALLKTYNIIDFRSHKKIGRIKRRFSIGKNFSVAINGQASKVKGSLFGFQFEIVNKAGENMLSVKKKLISWGDSYEVFIDEAKINPEIACAVCIAFDNAVHNNKKR